ncbi:Acyl carrier protein 1, chloroplastic-like protein [Drosera capensis]
MLRSISRSPMGNLVLRTFPRCRIIGRRFPICHVHVGGYIVEISSFSTRGRKFKKDSSYEGATGCDEKDYSRWKDCVRRDFTINGLIFDPFGKIVYDYTGVLEDMKKARVRTIIPAEESLEEDRGLLPDCFLLDRETAKAVKSLSTSILRLDETRLMMEMNYMLAYGSAEASLRLLWKFGLLEILLPIQAAYLVANGFQRRYKRSNMLLVFIPLGLYLRLCKILECVRKGPENDFVPKQGGRIDYEALAMGTLEEVSFERAECNICNGFSGCRTSKEQRMKEGEEGNMLNYLHVAFDKIKRGNSGVSETTTEDASDSAGCIKAKPEIVDKVCHIVRKQLALPPETELSGESKFTTLGADSLDTVEIVMGLEEEFGISVEEESSQDITTVQEAADLIEKLVGSKCEA